MQVVADRLSQGYGLTTVIEQFSTTLEPGITALLGPNGAGKTTLLRTLATIMPPRRGTLAIDGALIDSERAARRVRDNIGYLPQNFGFDPRMRLVDFVTYAAWLRGWEPSALKLAVERALSMTDLAAHRKMPMRKLSGGMQQRAGIAWAIVGEPRLVLLDEPTVGLDPRQRLHFREIISSLTESIVVLSTHLIDDVAAIGDRVIVMHGGASRFDGTTSELELHAPNDVPGHSPLERGYMSMLPAEEQRL